MKKQYLNLILLVSILLTSLPTISSEDNNETASPLKETNNLDISLISSALTYVFQISGTDSETIKKAISSFIESYNKMDDHSLIDNIGLSKRDFLSILISSGASFYGLNYLLKSESIGYDILCLRPHLEKYKACYIDMWAGRGNYKDQNGRIICDQSYKIILDEQLSEQLDSLKHKDLNEKDIKDLKKSLETTSLYKNLYQLSNLPTAEQYEAKWESIKKMKELINKPEEQLRRRQLREDADKIRGLCVRDYDDQLDYLNKKIVNNAYRVHLITQSVSLVLELNSLLETRAVINNSGIGIEGSEEIIYQINESFQRLKNDLIKLMNSEKEDLSNGSRTQLEIMRLKEKFNNLKHLINQKVCEFSAIKKYGLEPKKKSSVASAVSNSISGGINLYYAFNGNASKCLRILGGVIGCTQLGVAGQNVSNICEILEKIDRIDKKLTELKSVHNVLDLVDSELNRRTEELNSRNLISEID